MRAVMLSVQPKWCELIASREKTIEVRKTKPKLETPFKVYIYRTKGFMRHLRNGKWWNMPVGGKVIGEFVCDEIKEITADNLVALYFNNPSENTCLNDLEMRKYAAGKNLFLWHISNLKIYDNPKQLCDFLKCGAQTEDELEETLCSYCIQTDYGEHRCFGTPNGPVFCEGAFCGEAYQAYLDDNFALSRPPQSWCYVEEKEMEE